VQTSSETDTEGTVRTAFACASPGTRLPAEDSLPPGAAPEDIADEAIASGGRFTMVPARIKRIDRGLARLGVDWSFPALAGLDPGRSDSWLAGSDLAHIAVQVVLNGGQGINVGTIGAIVRALAPAGGIAPLAGQVEYRWPISRGEEPSGLPTMTSCWPPCSTAAATCEARPVTWPWPRRQPSCWTPSAWPRGCPDGPTGPARPLSGRSPPGNWARPQGNGSPAPPADCPGSCWAAHCEAGAGPASTAETALMLIFIRNMFRTVRQIVPAGSFDVMDNPMVAPPFLIDFLNR
jgi:hypothetical protein